MEAQRSLAAAGSQPVTGRLDGEAIVANPEGRGLIGSLNALRGDVDYLMAEIEFLREATSSAQNALRANENALSAEQKVLRAEVMALRANENALRTMVLTAEEKALRAEEKVLRADQQAWTALQCSLKTQGMALTMRNQDLTRYNRRRGGKSPAPAGMIKLDNWSTPCASLELDVLVYRQGLRCDEHLFEELYGVSLTAAHHIVESQNRLLVGVLEHHANLRLDHTMILDPIEASFGRFISALTAAINGAPHEPCVWESQSKHEREDYERELDARGLKPDTLTQSI